jgi:hypothetical protein
VVMLQMESDWGMAFYNSPKKSDCQSK